MDDKGSSNRKTGNIPILKEVEAEEEASEESGGLWIGQGESFVVVAKEKNKMNVCVKGRRLQ